MLNQKICLVDFQEAAYQGNSVYTQILSRSQLDLLYLSQALAVRPNQVSVMSEREHMLTAHGIDYLQIPDQPQDFWPAAAFDAIICLDSLQAVHQIRPHLPQSSKLILWTHLPPEHIAMLPLKVPEVQQAFDAIICETGNLRGAYLKQYQLPPEKVIFFVPAIVRTLRKRFASAQELGQIRHQRLTLGFMARPEAGLAETLNCFETLQAGFSDLQLQIMLPPEFKAEDSNADAMALLAQARQMPGIQVKDACPWTNHIEDILKCHLMLQPVMPPHNEALRLINALGAGCQLIATEQSSLWDFCHDMVHWVSTDPAENFLQRFTQSVADCLTQQINAPADCLDNALEQAAKVQTGLTWDLRVWEWESLLYHMNPPQLSDTALSAQ
ncbi:MAG: hypothetical protein IGS03_07130 [Candidatus Sericytochromatia bacterium]|nr:hypothetical protein [Candidatus Sericytochromatia bacterium]